MFAYPPPPPFYAVTFTFQLRRDADVEAYEAAAAELRALAEQRPDFFGEEAVRVDGHLSITISYWRDLEAIAAWRRHPRHAEIRARGVAEWYESYELRVARVERVSSFESPRTAPTP
ncbi:MAG: antibiotic biosynthesis monooxygenase [Gemmatimonadales bacterium]|jgi:heme-degrading monooxygenase HmoA